MKKFIKRKEDFVCKKCGTFNKGDGYTNHCSFCLFSLHVDENPGDRRSRCGGVMEPINLEYKSDKFIIVFQCQKCGMIKKNRASQKDNLDILFEKIKQKNELSN